ncbi:MAG TPA: hypothetical protein PKA27_09720 [Fimbriimonadaceae bacterium]|nr:hypothetical protein [Fimbriimonadaceae bacterium]
MSKKPTMLIGIAGGSGSGKTFLTRAVQKGAGEHLVSVLSMDQYFQNLAEGSRPEHTNFDHPGHIDFEHLINDLRSLKSGSDILAPDYDFANRCRRQEPLLVRAHPVVIVEGLFVLADPIHHLLDLTCYLDVAPDQRLLGRILRDSKERSANIAQIVDRYQRFVRPAYDVFVAPTKHNADVVVDFTYRRQLFTELLTHIAKDYVSGDLDFQALVKRVRVDTMHMGYQPEEGTMPFSVDIRKLAKAYPPSMIPHGVPMNPGETPNLFLSES